MFAPEQETVDSVKEWPVDHGIDPKRITRSGNKGWLACSARVEEAEALLHAE
jgi:tripeptidyl-peptidase-1